MIELGSEFSGQSRLENEAVLVKFFDDEDFELFPVADHKKVELYSCKNKTKRIKAGFKKHEENKRGALGGANLRLAQFYKDVEMAEVMTDNDASVGDILATYEIADYEEVVDEPVSEPSKPKPAKKAGKGKKKGGNKNSNDILREVKNGGVRK